MRIIIIGSEGFIGQHCIKHFLRSGHQVIGCDLLNIKPAYEYFQISRFNPDYENIFQSNCFDICINAAGNGSVPVSIEKPLLDFEANVYDNLRLLEQIRLHQPTCKYVYLSSAAVYGNPELPVKENNEIRPVSPYGWHKFQAEQICKEYSSLYDITTIVLRPFSVFGPGLKKQIIWDLFNKFTKTEKVEVYGTGKESRDFVFITDLIQAMDYVLQNISNTHEVYNIASGKEIFIEEVVNQIATKLGKSKDDYFFNGFIRQGDPINWVADISKLTNIGFVPAIAFEEGLNETIVWLKANQ